MVKRTSGNHYSSSNDYSRRASDPRDTSRKTQFVASSPAHNTSRLAADNAHAAALAKRQRLNFVSTTKSSNRTPVVNSFSPWSGKSEQQRFYRDGSKTVFTHEPKKHELRAKHVWKTGSEVGGSFNTRSYETTAHYSDRRGRGVDTSFAPKKATVYAGGHSKGYKLGALVNPLGVRAAVKTPLVKFNSPYIR